MREFSFKGMNRAVHAFFLTRLAVLTLNIFANPLPVMATQAVSPLQAQFNLTGTAQTSALEGMIVADGKLEEGVLTGTVSLRFQQGEEGKQRVNGFALSLEQVGYEHAPWSILEATGHLEGRIEQGKVSLTMGELEVKSVTWDALKITQNHLKIEALAKNSLRWLLKGSLFGGRYRLVAETPSSELSEGRLTVFFENVDANKLADWAPELAQRFEGELHGEATGYYNREGWELETAHIWAQAGAQLNVSGTWTDGVMAEINTSIRESIRQGLIQQGIDPQQVEWQGGLEAALKHLELESMDLEFDASRADLPLRATIKGSSTESPQIPFVIEMNVRGNLLENKDLLKRFLQK